MARASAVLSRPNLSELERSILYLVAARKVALTSHIYELNQRSEHPIGLRFVQRVLKRLEAFGLVRSRKYVVSHLTYGTSSKLWRVTKKGLKIAAEQDNRLSFRLLFWNDKIEQSTIHHSIAVNDTELQVRKLIPSATVEPEPLCWRKYKLYAYAKEEWLKPDLFAKMGDTDYYIELDRGTERPVRIVEKCKTYVSYFLTEQRLGRLKSPYKVIWLVPDAKRKNSLDRHIKKHLGGNAWVFQIVLQPLFTDFLTAKIQNLLDFSGVPSDECKDPENLTVTKGAKNGETNEK